MRDLGVGLQTEAFQAEALGGRVRAAFDGLQRLRSLDLDVDGALEALGGDRGRLAQEVLGALQEAHDSSREGTEGRVWQLHKDNVDLLQAPLLQIGVGSSVEDLWAGVTRNETTVRLATELFVFFDADVDGYWNLRETSQVQQASEGTEMSEDAFSSLIIAVADNKGRDLVEEDLALGLSLEQVIELYTDAQRQKSLGFLLDIYKDHAAVFGAGSQLGEPEEAVEADAVDVP